MVKSSHLMDEEGVHRLEQRGVMVKQSQVKPPDGRGGCASARAERSHGQAKSSQTT
jgi:hypothetical protein